MKKSKYEENPKPKRKYEKNKYGKNPEPKKKKKITKGCIKRTKNI